MKYIDSKRVRWGIVIMDCIMMGVMIGVIWSVWGWCEGGVRAILCICVCVGMIDTVCDVVKFRESLYM